MTEPITKESIKVLCLGSRKFYEKVEENVRKFREAGFNALTPEKPQGDLTPEQDLEARLRFWHRVKTADKIYIETLDGYIGEDGIKEVGYSYACSKDIITSEEISPNTTNYKFNRELISRVLDRDKFIAYCKNGNHR